MLWNPRIHFYRFISSSTLCTRVRAYTKYYLFSTVRKSTTEPVQKTSASTLSSPQPSTAKETTPSSAEKSGSAGTRSTKVNKSESAFASLCLKYLYINTYRRLRHTCILWLQIFFPTKHQEHSSIFSYPLDTLTLFSILPNKWKYWLLADVLIRWINPFQHLNIYIIALIYSDRVPMRNN